MIYLLIAMALCLLVPLLPLFLFRRLPRRPPPPLSEEELQRLGGQIHRPLPLHGVEVVADENGPPSTEIRPQMAAASEAPRRNTEECEGQESTRSNAYRGRAATSREIASRRFSLASYRWLYFAWLPIFILTGLALTLGWAWLLDYLAEERARSFLP